MVLSRVSQASGCLGAGGGVSSEGASEWGLLGEVAVLWVLGNN